MKSPLQKVLIVLMVEAKYIWAYKAETAYDARFLRKAPVINQTNRRWSLC